MRAPIRGVVALRMAEYPAGSQRAATAYIRKGTPELMMPSTMMDLSLP